MAMGIRRRTVVRAGALWAAVLAWVPGRARGGGLRDASTPAAAEPAATEPAATDPAATDPPGSPQTEAPERPLWLGHW